MGSSEDMVGKFFLVSLFLILMEGMNDQIGLGFQCWLNYCSFVRKILGKPSRWTIVQQKVVFAGQTEYSEPFK